MPSAQVYSVRLLPACRGEQWSCSSSSSALRNRARGLESADESLLRTSYSDENEEQAHEAFTQIESDPGVAAGAGDSQLGMFG